MSICLQFQKKHNLKKKKKNTKKHLTVEKTHEREIKHKKPLTGGIYAHQIGPVYRVCNILDGHMWEHQPCDI